MAHVSAEESKRNDQAVLGQSYGLTFFHCRQLLWEVSGNWDRYETLYGSAERVEILNECSGHFWATIQSMLHEHVLLGLCRLTDPAQQGRFRNMSVRRLAEIDPTPDKHELLRRVERAVELTAFARSWRDKKIAHNDFDQVSGTNETIDPSTGLKISGAIVAIHNVLKWVLGRYFDGDMFLVDLGDSDANQVIFDLARAKQLKAQDRIDLEQKRYDRLLQRRDLFPQSDYGRERRYATQSDLPQPPRYTGPLPLVT